MNRMARPRRGATTTCSLWIVLSFVAVIARASATNAAAEKTAGLRRNYVHPYSKRGQGINEAQRGDRKRTKTGNGLSSTRRTQQQHQQLRSQRRLELVLGEENDDEDYEATLIESVDEVLGMFGTNNTELENEVMSEMEDILDDLDGTRSTSNETSTTATKSPGNATTMTTPIGDTMELTSIPHENKEQVSQMVPESTIAPVVNGTGQEIANNKNETDRTGDGDNINLPVVQLEDDALEKEEELLDEEEGIDHPTESDDEADGHSGLQPAKKQGEDGEENKSHDDEPAVTPTNPSPSEASRTGVPQKVAPDDDLYQNEEKIIKNALDSSGGGPNGRYPVLATLLGLAAMIFTAWQMSDNPDGVFASLCRLILTAIQLLCRIVTQPCRKACGCQSHNNPYGSVSTMDYGYKDPALELS
jgi:hypothetical protein